MHWLTENYRWLFDGVGGVVVVAALGYLWHRFRDKAGQETQAGKPASNERQARLANVLVVIHSKFEGALFNLQRAASADKFHGEAPDEELLRRVGVDLAAASTEYSQKKLLMDVSLTSKIDEFFSKAVSTGRILNHALDPITPNGEMRANYWKQAQEITTKELPPILEAIRKDARAVIHRS